MARGARVAIASTYQSHAQGTLEVLPVSDLLRQLLLSSLGGMDGVEQGPVEEHLIASGNKTMERTLSVRLL